MRTINRLEEGDVIRYAPLLRSNEKRKGDISIVLIPALRNPKEDPLTVLEPKPAEKPANSGRCRKKSPWSRLSMVRMD